jgi:hypothetical protein
MTATMATMTATREQGRKRVTKAGAPDTDASPRAPGMVFLTFSLYFINNYM